MVDSINKGSDAMDYLAGMKQVFNLLDQEIQSYENGEYSG
jgi:hypothetical protein